jgi:hypothetical protein
MFLFLSTRLGTAGARANLNKLWLIGPVMAWPFEIGRVCPLYKRFTFFLTGVDAHGGTMTKEEQEDIKRAIKAHLRSLQEKEAFADYVL